ncbi:MAG: hypothetical protein B6I24_07200 [Bacteroidetes bacterium 4572_128]|nr:MAG: hypothetical protein B6I24_07200 [Bacteroidetes bacterium 4572_128]
MYNSYNLGKIGENIAKKFLQKKSYEILETNFFYKKNEIDIIAKYQNLLIVVEVKIRKTNFFGEPYLSVDLKKQKKIIKVTNFYIIEKNIDLEVRFDIISIVGNKKIYKIEHIKNAFYPTNF